MLGYCIEARPLFSVTLLKILLPVYMLGVIKVLLIVGQKILERQGVYVLVLGHEDVNDHDPRNIT